MTETDCPRRTKDHCGTEFAGFQNHENCKFGSTNGPTWLPRFGDNEALCATLECAHMQKVLNVLCNDCAWSHPSSVARTRAVGRAPKEAHVTKAPLAYPRCGVSKRGRHFGLDAYAPLDDALCDNYPHFIW